MEPCKVCVEKSDQIREILRPFQLEHVEPVGGVRILGKSLAEARAQVAALTAERDAAKAELAAAKQDTERVDWLETGMDITCDEGHLVHRHGCALLYSNGSIMQLVSKSPEDLHWKRITWREAVDAAMLAARAPEGTEGKDKDD